MLNIIRHLKTLNLHQYPIQYCCLFEYLDEFRDEQSAIIDSPIDITLE